MNVFIQGMRRSGTTIVYDVLLEDGRFDCYYEPLAAATREARGGGSGVHAEDFFEKIRAVRAEFIEQRGLGEDPDLLNYGAPRDPALELETTLPDLVTEYIRYMCRQADDTVIKFTRMGCKVRVLHEIDPDAHFVHVVRDPRAVATSYLYGRDQRNASRFEGNELFFQRRSTRAPWSAYAFSETLLALPEYAHLHDLLDFERILLVWKHLARATHEAGRAFGDRYHLLRHEDLLRNPEETVRALYRSMDGEASTKLLEWSKANVQGTIRIHEPEHPGWVESIRRVGAERELAELGYVIEVTAT